ncbi:MAG: ribulose-phosphate 3-epimerase [Erysipelotrichaceae bacterium]|jgi:ribulose-phosphate 3-epimerase|nr:ribulose-phosphate 3-epimerase [Erysipelotrichaceae bacterium]
MDNVLIAPSLLSADFAHLAKEVIKIAKTKATILHFDVMDGHFVKNLSFGIPVFKAISRLTSLINDVHLMTENPHVYFDDYLKHGAQMITFHLEAYQSEAEIKKHLEYLHDHKIKPGLSLRPGTNITKLYKFLPLLNHVLIMSVNPGRGGQEFVKDSLDRIRQLKRYLKQHQLSTLIEVDGGINETTAPLVKQAGADILVSGSYIFKAKSYRKAVLALL